MDHRPPSEVALETPSEMVLGDLNDMALGSTNTYTIRHNYYKNNDNNNNLHTKHYMIPHFVGRTT